MNEFLGVVDHKKKKQFFLVFIGFSILVMLTLCENGYEGMSPVQEMITAYLSVADILSQGLAT